MRKIRAMMVPATSTLKTIFVEGSENEYSVSACREETNHSTNGGT